MRRLVVCLILTGGCAAPTTPHIPASAQPLTMAGIWTFTPLPPTCEFRPPLPVGRAVVSQEEEHFSGAIFLEGRIVGTIEGIQPLGSRNIEATLTFNDQNSSCFGTVTLTGPLASTSRPPMCSVLFKTSDQLLCSRWCVKRELTMTRTCGQTIR
jgi:hypothetical protein